MTPSRDLSPKPNYYHQMEGQKHAEKRLSKPIYNSQHQLFCDQMGIIFPRDPHSEERLSSRRGSYFWRRQREYRSHTWQYWFVASMTTSFFILQIMIGAIQTAIGATRSPHALVVIFGALATVIGGLLAYLKSRGQPNRCRQLRNGLRKVIEAIVLEELELRNPQSTQTAKDAVDHVNTLYDNARYQAETNYPDFWSTAGTKSVQRTTGGGTTSGPAPPRQRPSHPAPVHVSRGHEKV